MDWNGVNSGSSIAERFEEIARRYGSSVAVIDENTSYTFAQLKALVQNVAGCIQQSGANSTQPVALMFGPSVYRIAGLLAAVLSGRPFVPLDVAYPPERNKLILQDSGAKLFLSDTFCKSSYQKIEPFLDTLINLDDIDPDKNIEFQFTSPTPTDMCAIIYTSGSTGRPNGVMHSQKSLFENARNTSMSMGLRPDDRFLQASPSASIASVSEILSSVLSASTCLPFSLYHQNFNDLGDFIQKHALTVFNGVPTVFRYLCQSQNKHFGLNSLRLVRLGGEPVFASDLVLCRDFCNQHTVLQVAFGSTETGLNSTQNYYQNSIVESGTSILSMGSAVPGKSILVLKQDMQPASINEIGEVYISGSGLSSGYFNRPELTSSKFIIHRNEHGRESVFYRSGDQALINPDNLLVFAGRKDQQLKIHGFRIEPTEVEAALMQFDEVNACAVVLREVNSKSQLLAYLSIKHSNQNTERVIREFLQERLPVHMIPAFFIFLDSMPLNPNGKIDRNQLPQPEINTPPDIAVHASNISPTMAELLRIWEKLLGRQHIRVDDNFFSLGGDSLLLLSLSEEINNHFHRKIDVGAILQNPTIALLASLIDATAREFNTNCIKFNTDLNTTPLVFIGSGAYIHYFADAMKSSRPVYAFDVSGYIELAAFKGDYRDLTLEKMAAVYTNMILDTLPGSRIVLAGYSFYGLLAFEVGHQLVKSGMEIENLVLLDTILSKFVVSPALQRMNSLIKSKPSVVQVDACKVNAALTKYSKSDAFISWADFQDCAKPVRSYVRDAYQFRPLNTYGILIRREFTAPLKIQIKNLDYGWSSYFERGMDLHQSKGKHEDFVNTPNIEGLAQKLNNILS